MKYIIDIDALKDCLDLLPVYYDPNVVDLRDVKKLIDKFPKEKYGMNSWICLQSMMN